MKFLGQGYNPSMFSLDFISLEKRLGLCGLHYYPSISSTNDSAMQWLKNGGKELSVVLADEQTAGRGRMERKWITQPGVSLAFSVILKPKPEEKVQLFSGLGAVAVCDALIQVSRLSVEIKWPNDILINGKKVCGILAEAHWEHDECVGIVLGIGINVGKLSVPLTPEINYSATSIETEYGKIVPREEIFEQILRSLIEWRQWMRSPKLLEYWRNHLAYLHQSVRVEAEGRPSLVGILDGIGDSSDLRIITKDGKTISVDMGEVHLRLMDQPV